MAPEPLRARTALFAAMALVVCSFVPAAHAARLIDWNILNYPGTTGATRDPNYRVVLGPLSPDILVTEETTSQAGVTEFTNSLNVMEPGQWTSAPFLDGNDTDSGLFYKPSKFQFLGQWGFYPNPASLLRLVHVYRLKPVGYSSDAAEIRLYSVHLKASMGFETQRGLECQGIRDTLNALPIGIHAAVLGDYNFYTGLEPGMQKLVESEVNNRGQLVDPLGLQNVAWQDNTSMQPAWTQSPCKTGDTGCASGAATGGLDDRFDLILPTHDWQDGAGIELLPGTYISVGNDGLHHNNSIQDPPTIPEGAAYATALHSVSDHLPVRIDFQLPALLGLSTSPIAFGTAITGASVSPQTLDVTNLAPVPGEVMTYAFTTVPSGFTAPVGTRTAGAGVTNHEGVGFDTSTPGSFGGSLEITSNSVDVPVRDVTLSGTVLRHASPSLDSAAVVTSGVLDFGTHDAGQFAPLDVRVHNQGDDALQAQLVVSGSTITGGAGRFSITAGSTPQTLAGIGATFSVAFDDNGATADSTYDGTLTFASADEALPGAQARPDLSLALHARRSGGSNVGVDDTPPAATVLFAPFPNPLQGSSTMRYDLAKAGRARLEIFDPAGRRIARLVDGERSAGRYSVRWDGRSDAGATMGAGLYFVKFTAPGGHSQVARLAIVR